MATFAPSCPHQQVCPVTLFILVCTVLCNICTCTASSSPSFPHMAIGQPYLEVDTKRLQPGAVIVTKEKESLSLSCIITGAASAVRRISWFLGDQNVTHSSLLLIQYMADEDNYSTQSLLVLNVTKDHNGKTVTCHAEHMAWQVPAVTVASLDVLYEPAFSISREPGFGYPIVEGMSVSLKCIIDANPKSEAKWIKDGDMNQSKYSSNQHQVPAEMRTNLDGELYLPAATVNSSGWYRCATDHRFGHFASFGYYLNVRTELPNLQHVLKLPLLPPHSQSANSINKESRELVPRQPSAAGPDVVASGVAPARAQAEHELPPSRQMATYQASSSRSGDIMINSGLYLNSNHGTQQPKNGHPLQGLVDQQLHQSQRQGCPEMVGRPIVVATNRTVMAFLGRPISVSAEFCCSPRPKKVYWVHRHLAMAPGRIIGPYITKELSPASNSRNCYMSTFDIDSVKLEDAGEIMFLVSNSKGLDETDILLNVTRAGYSVSSADHCWFSSKCLSSLLLFVIIIPTVIIGFE